MHNKLYFSMVLLYAVNTAWGYYTLEGDTRVVSGDYDAPFSYRTTLPGIYTLLKSGIHEVAVGNGTCSTPFFSCSYTMDQNDGTMLVTMEGRMSWGLKWVTFMTPANATAQYLVPISIIFFTNGIWNDLASGSIQPQYSVPLIVAGKGKTTITLTCSIFSTSAKYSLFTGVNNTKYWSNVRKESLDEIKNHSQILNVEMRNILLHKVVTLTVKKLNDIDFYSCNTGDYWLTHTIDWTRSGGKHIAATISSLIGLLMYFLA